MSRFDQDLDHDLTVIAERVTPSPDAWAEIQQRIADRQPEQDTEIIMLTENTLTRRRWPLVAAAAAVAALAIGAIALVNRDDGVEQPADVPEPAPTVAPDDQTIDSPDLSTLIPGTEIVPGRYEAGMLGLPVSFEVPATEGVAWTLQDVNDRSFSLETGGVFVAMTRIGSFYDAEQAQNPDMVGLGSIPPNGVDEWIDANGVIVTDSDETTVDGQPTRFRLVRAPAGAGATTGLCPVEAQPCLNVSSGSADLMNARVTSEPVGRLTGELDAAFWIIELDDFEPLGIALESGTADPEQFLPAVTALTDSIELGEPAPAVAGGTARISTFDPGIPEEIVATGSYEAVRTSGDPLADGSVAESTTMSIQGDVAGEATGVGTAVIEEAGVSEEGVEEFIFTGTIDGVGTGTVTWTLRLATRERHLLLHRAHHGRHRRLRRGHRNDHHLHPHGRRQRRERRHVHVVPRARIAPGARTVGHCEMCRAQLAIT